jgi:hypothetical protein
MFISRDVTFSEVSNDNSSAILDESLGDSSSVGDIPCKTLGEKGEKGNVNSTPMSETGNGSDQTVQENEEVEPELMTNDGAGDDPVDCFVEDAVMTLLTTNRESVSPAEIVVRQVHGQIVP